MSTIILSNKISRLGLIWVALSMSLSPAVAEPVASAPVSDRAEVLRVGGVYSIARIDKVEGGGFRIEFHNDEVKGRFQTLKLESDHVNMGVSVGQKLRLSAEVLKEKGNEAEVSQVLLFLPHAEGPVPVWLLSKKGGELRGARYLEMHAPTTDYQIL